MMPDIQKSLGENRGICGTVFGFRISGGQSYKFKDIAERQESRTGWCPPSHRVVQLDDLLGHVVSWSSLASDHDGARHAGLRGVPLDPVVQGADVQDVQKLSLVLVDTLHLGA